MSEINEPTPEIEKTRPPYLVFTVALVLMVAFAAFLGYEAHRNDRAIRDGFKAVEQLWDARVENSSLPNHDQNLIEAAEDRQALKKLEGPYFRFYTLLFMAMAGLVAFALMMFIGYRLMLVSPLRKLEKSCRALAAGGLKGHIWGLDRGDHYGGLARSIEDIRNAVVTLSDMVVEGRDGTAHVQFGGRGAATFNALVADLRDSIAHLQEQGNRFEKISDAREENLVQLDDVVRKQSHSLEAAVDASRVQLAGLQDEWTARFTALSGQQGTMQEKADALVNQFQQDMTSLRQVASATGQRVAQMLQSLGATDHDYKRAARLSLEASEAFARQAHDLSEKLGSATSLLRASGKVMAETTDATRTRLLEAVNSVNSHDKALKDFLGETAQKTEQITTMFDDMRQNAGRIADVVVQFDTRMSDFEAKSDVAFARIENGGDIMENAASQLTGTQDILTGSLDAMHGHTDMLARILITIRDEYAGFMDNWKDALSEATPAIAQLKEAGDVLRGQLSNEWAHYTTQSRQLLGALEHDVRGMNARAQQVTQDTARLVENLNAQTQRLSDSTSHFDLQIAGLSQRLENAASSVIQSNSHVVELTSSQVREVHMAVQDMAQRLGILTQLTGTLGAVAGQLGQIVPAMGDVRQLQHAGIPLMGASSGMDPAVAQRFEKIGADFTSTIDQIRDEFGTVRGQISRWVETLSSGYQTLAAQVGAMDGALESRIEALKADMQGITPSGGVTVVDTDGLLPAIRQVQDGLAQNKDNSAHMLEDLEGLKRNVQSMSQHIGQTTQIMQALSGIVAEGFARLDETAPTPAARQTITQAPAAKAPPLPSEAPVSLDQLQAQINAVTATLDRCASQSGVLTSAEKLDEPTLDKSRAIIGSVTTAIGRLNQIAESIERMADAPGPESGAGEKAG